MVKKSKQNIFKKGDLINANIWIKTLFYSNIYLFLVFLISLTLFFSFFFISYVQTNHSFIYQLETALHTNSDDPFSVLKNNYQIGIDNLQLIRTYYIIQIVSLVFAALASFLLIYLFIINIIVMFNDKNNWFTAKNLIKFQIISWFWVVYNLITSLKNKLKRMLKFWKHKKKKSK